MGIFSVTIPLVRQRVTRYSLVMLISTVTLSLTAVAYDIKPAKQNLRVGAALSNLQQLSRGVSEVAEQSAGAIVFVNVSKRAAENPLAMNPFDFFFGRPSPDGQRAPQAPTPPQQGVGSGFFIDLDKGYVVTNNHVIEGADEIELRLANGTVVEGEVVGRDPNTDIAVVEAKEFRKKGLAALRFAKSDELKVGDFVVALGAPFGLEASVSFGVISAVGRGSMGIAELGDFIQTDAAINPGNSGGPLIDTTGRVVGVNTAIYSRTGGFNGVGFAVPSDLVMSIAEQLITDGSIKRGYIGASLQPLSIELIEQLNLPADTKGALVANTIDGAPAKKFGIEPGDVIVGIDGVTVDDSSDVVTKLGLMKPGKKVQMDIYRDGKKRRVDVTLGEWPGNDRALAGGMDSSGDMSNSGELGLALTPNGGQVAERFSLTSEGGLVVMDIRPDSPAAKAGLRPGDLILSVNRQDVSTVNDFQNQVKKGKRLLLRVERAGTFFFEGITVE